MVLGQCDCFFTFSKVAGNVLTVNLHAFDTLGVSFFLNKQDGFIWSRGFREEIRSTKAITVC